MHLLKEELLRYQRQIIIPGIGEEGQKKIKGAHVFVAGLGGLGSLSAYYLVAAGVGTVTIADKDVVDIGNLNRQIIHWTNDIGMQKTDSAFTKLMALNPHCNIRSIQAEISRENVVELAGDCSLIVDATDNLETRRALNHVSLMKRIPFIYGGINGFNGMVSTFVPPQTPCFDCVFSGVTDQKGPIGVLGAVPGIIASIQAMEAIKVILGMDSLLKGRLLCFSGLDMSFKEIAIEKNLDCKTCSGF